MHEVCLYRRRAKESNITITTTSWADVAKRGLYNSVPVRRLRKWGPRRQNERTTSRSLQRTAATHPRGVTILSYDQTPEAMQVILLNEDDTSKVTQ
jgi:hypothetical protein